MFNIDVLPALHGDALWIEYGDPHRPHRLLVDGGPHSKALDQVVDYLITERIDKQGGRGFDLVTVTHVDADHIAGVLKLFERGALDPAPHDVWFNGWRHLPDDVLGAKQGERLSAAIVEQGMPWNRLFEGRAVVVPDDGPLPVTELPGGMRLTLLSPTRQALKDLVPVWRKEVVSAGLVPGAAADAAERDTGRQPDVLGARVPDPEVLAAAPFVEDGSAANASSIAFLAEFEGRSALFTGDAHAGVLTSGLRRLARERGVEVVPVDVCKVSHHGSRYNVDRDGLDLLMCDRYILSTNGGHHQHPDWIALGRIVTAKDHAVRLECNYRTEFTRPWESRRLTRKFDYSIVYPHDRPLLRVAV